MKYDGSTLLESRLNLIVGNQNLGQIKKVYSGSETLSYFGNDHLGSRVLVYDSTGVVSNKFDYSVWGEATQTFGNDTSLISFTGKQLDTSGLYYFNARYYDPITGRFVTEDPVFKGESLYVYCVDLIHNNASAYIFTI